MTRVVSQERTHREAVFEAWRQTLEIDSAREDENFFDAGGNSILLVQLQRSLAAKLGFKIPLQEIFHHPTIGELARRVEVLAPAPAPAERQELNLYCLPYAGCSARVYDRWKASAPEFLNVIPVELPGRGSRCTDRPISSLPELLDDLSASIDADGHVPYVLFGHSFGAILAYELGKRLISDGLPGPRSLMVSACRPPHLATPEVPVFDRPDRDFRNRLRELRGTLPELLENEELMELYIPVIRADYSILDNYRSDDSADIGCPIFALYGSADDDANGTVIGQWDAYTRASFSAHEIPGDHFFLHSAEGEIVSRISAHLAAMRQQ
ncbi:alpha/beta fold hydrolase [Streptomyces turgidiscabies]|uniref:Thioesterase domain protein n=2 Tax=Streptomyces turgidiscabies TaxID=85558 RepID=L7ESQ8_STRT8|nr:MULTISPECIES: alpha/beta fold hydrolase [Streptomyces]ELP61736.1 thioesterase domain protein [Streptomyces turgidiscabies Car8]MDX3493327.1 alpha/beta fold hydrolase [Streptomyces turgidiscabies]BAP59947.1 putative type II thioesterase [Streptomyces turgidiscabies]GAQ70630.1 linear gramicidin dehydrogenase LgrE [Streptomyces turgidiscabies]